jgi:hypothetical protein
MRTRLAPAWVGALTLATLLVGCAQSLPSGPSLVRQVAAAMALAGSYRISGSDRAGPTTTSFRVVVHRDGDFSGTLDIAVPHSPTFRSDIVAVGEKVYVRSPTELEELGITSLPGNLNPKTTWVLQPSSVATSYRKSLNPFARMGLAATLRRALKGPLTVRRSQLGGRRVLLVQETGGRSSLRLFVQPATDHLLELAITGPQPVTLDYDAFGIAQKVEAPPSSLVYVPPTGAGAG